MGGRSKELRQALKKTPQGFPMAHPCHKGHNHVWPESGPITKEDVGPCQVVCQFCSLDFKNPTFVEAKWGWHLRRHVYQVHKKTHPLLDVPEEWSGKKSTSKGKKGPKKGETQTGKKKSAEKTAKKAQKTPKKTAQQPDLSLITPPMSNHATPPAYPALGYTSPQEPVQPAVEFNLDSTNFDALFVEIGEAGIADLMGVENEPTQPDIDWDAFMAPDAFDPVYQDAPSGTFFFEEALNDYVSGSEFCLL